MMLDHRLAGVHAAAVTPLTPAGTPDTAALADLLDGLAARGCHGVLLLGTTGEGPSFSSSERQLVMEAAAGWRQTAQPDFVLMAGTGTPSLTETIALNHAAFELSFDAVVTLPPYFLRNASEGGLYDWYDAVITESVPESGFMLGYHIPQVSGVGLSGALLRSLRERFPSRFAGIKDSTGSFEHARELLDEVDDGFVLLAGNDSLLADELAIGASGCITAMANIFSAQARAVFDAFITGEPTDALQAQLSALRTIVDRAAPLPAAMKALLRELHDTNVGEVRAPLLPLEDELVGDTLAAIYKALDA